MNNSMNNKPSYQEIISFLDQQPTTPEIQYFLENQIYTQMYYFKDLLNDDKVLFAEYLRQQILSAEKAMTDMIYEIRNRNVYRKVIITGNAFRLKNEKISSDVSITPEMAENFTWNKERILIYKAELQAQPKGGITTDPVSFISLFADAINDCPVSKRDEVARERIRVTIDCLKAHLDKNNHWRKMDEGEDANLIIVPWHVLRKKGIIRQPKSHGRAADMRAWCLYFGHTLTDSQQRYFGNPPLDDLMEWFEKDLEPVFYH
jgi:hypothetical protein